MSQRIVERVVGKLVTDEGFRNKFFKDPEKVSFFEGFDLSRKELQSLVRIPKTALASLSERLDDRICRLHVPVEPSEGE